MSAATVYFEVDGKPHPATDCHWLEIASCGCPSAIHVAAYELSGELTVHHTAEAAFFHDTPRVVQEYEKTLGHSYKLITHQQYRDTYIKQFQSTCPHSPQWGIPAVPVPVGWTWKCSDGIGRRTHRKHIVQTETPDGSREKAAALCGKETYGWAWGAEAHHLFQTVPCSKCVKRAHEKSPALPIVEAVAP